MGQILYHTALLVPSLQDADPWTLALDTVLGLSPRLLKQSTPVNPMSWDQWDGFATVPVADHWSSLEWF